MLILIKIFVAFNFVEYFNFYQMSQGKKGTKMTNNLTLAFKHVLTLVLRGTSLFFFSFLKRLIVFIHHNSGQLHFPITEILKGVMNYYIKTYFTHKHIALIIPLGIFVIEKCSNIEL